MTAEGVLALAIAAAAMYGIGTPLAWVLPAPQQSTWVYRIAVAPALAVAVAAPLAWLFTATGVPLHPAQLILILVACWVVAWRRTRAEWRLRQALGHAHGPAIIVVTAAVTWFASLRGYGLYLPNRDFKNHAYIVAQVASSRGADPAELLRASPVAPRAEGFYPHGLHTLLGWALPSQDFNSLGVTASAAVLAAVVSMPLAFIALARMLRPGEPGLWWIAGALGVLLPGLTSSFGIGSVVLIAGTALYSAGLTTVWLWLRGPNRAASISMAAVVLGLLLMHVAEAIGLVLVACAASLVLWRSGPLARMSKQELAITGAVGMAVGVVALAVFLRLGLTGLLERPVQSWDVEPNNFSVVTAPLAAFGALVGGSVPVFLLLLACVLVGTIILAREGDYYLLAAIAVPLALALVAGAAPVPDWLRVITAPWYGSVSRISMMLGAPLAVVAGVAVLPLWVEGRRLAERNRAGAALDLFVLACVAWLAAAAALGLVADRRGALWASLAGAGDTPRLAHELSAGIEPGQVVLNFEGDGTANLFAAARVPVVSGISAASQIGSSGPTGDELLAGLGRLSDPVVEDMMRAAGVAFVAIGTTSMYWTSQQGYSLKELLEQEELSVSFVGSDMTILMYDASNQ